VSVCSLCAYQLQPMPHIPKLHSARNMQRFRPALLRFRQAASSVSYARAAKAPAATESKPKAPSSDVTLSSLVGIVAKQCNYEEDDVKDVTQALLSTITQSVAEGKNVKLQGAHWITLEWILLPEIVLPVDLSEFRSSIGNPLSDYLPENRTAGTESSALRYQHIKQCRLRHLQASGDFSSHRPQPFHWRTVADCSVS
jgi:hypothetical protein